MLGHVLELIFGLLGLWCRMSTTQSSGGFCSTAMEVVPRCSKRLQGSSRHIEEGRLAAGDLQPSSCGRVEICGDLWLACLWLCLGGSCICGCLSTMKEYYLYLEAVDKKVHRPFDGQIGLSTKRPAS